MGEAWEDKSGIAVKVSGRVMDQFWRKFQNWENASHVKYVKMRSTAAGWAQPGKDRSLRPTTCEAGWVNNLIFF